MLQLLLEVLINGKGNGLTGCDTHDTGRDSFIESVDAFLSVGRGQRALANVFVYFEVIESLTARAREF
jgi:hypothetical protein